MRCNGICQRSFIPRGQIDVARERTADVTGFEVTRSTFTFLACNCSVWIAGAGIDAFVVYDVLKRRVHVATIAAIIFWSEWGGKMCLFMFLTCFAYHGESGF